MKISCGRSLVTTVLNTGAKDLREFEALNTFQRLEILTEVFQRAFLAFWMYSGKKTEWSRKRIVQRKKKDEVPASIDNEPLPQTVMLYSKALMSGGTLVDGEDPSEKKKPKATAKVEFSYDMHKDTLEVKITDISVEDPAQKDHFQRLLEAEIRAAKVAMESSLGMERFLKSFYDTLHVHRLTTIFGGEAVTMYRIYKNAKQAYPLFKELNYYTQIDLLRKGYRSARAMSGHSRDIHTFAKSTFEAFDAHGGVLGKVFAREPITNRFKTYTKVYENRQDRRNPDNSSQIWESNCLIFAEYEHPVGKDGATLRSSFLAFDLWDMLARNVYAERVEGLA